MLRFTVSVALCAALLACTGASVSGPPTVVARPTPSVVTDGTYGEARRRYLMLPVADPGRVPLRDRLVEHLLAQNGKVIGGDSYEAAVEHLAEITSLYTPDELAEGALPRALGPLARYLVEAGSPRGDEARVLSALLVLRLLDPRDKEAARMYQRVKEWGFDARAALSGPLERYEEGLVEAWEEHARLTPTPEVMRTVARLYVERRDALVRLFQSSEQRIPLSGSVFQGVQRTALFVAAVFLRHGDVASALTHIKAMGASGGVEERLIEILETAREDDADGAGALLDLARAYLEGGRPDVARALCLSGMRSRRTDARFAQCLARIAATEDDFDGATAWYADAVELAPEERALYDEILEVLNNLIEQGLFSTEVSNTRTIANRAAEILEERMTRWPDTPPPVKPEELYLAIAIAEMNAGNAQEAEEKLHASLQARETVDALWQLGLLLERMQRGQEAADAYRRALELIGGDGGKTAARRAEILERLGDALRMLGQNAEAARAYEEGLALWDRNISRLKGRRVGMAHLRRGILLGRLSRQGDSISAFEKAMELAPGVRETYASILAYLVVGPTDSAFAHRVFRSALNQLSLEPEWKVYFALWLRTIAGRSGKHTETDVDNVFEDLSTGDDWAAALAGFGRGKLSYEGLLERATGVGERTEAHFYEGTRRLASGDTEGAREMFRRVLETQMVNFYEFAMAQELIGERRVATAGEAPQPTQAHKQP